jgi:hypothetical protein
MNFNVYGYQVEVRSSQAPALESLASDFAYFRVEEVKTPVLVELHDQDPPYESAPTGPATVYTPRNVSVRDGQLTYVDYSGRGLAIHDRRTGNCRIYSRDPELLYEAAYLFLLSQIAEFLDRRRLHRIHALAISMAGRAALVLLPMGGGKSVLGAELLRYPEVKLLSDDAPLVDRAGRLHCFPLRLGLLPGSEGQIPPQALRRINRMEFGPKILVDYTYFADRVCPQADPGVVFLGHRSFSRNCEILPAGLGAATRAMITNCVVGLGLFQGMEFVLQRSLGELAGKAGVAWSRFRNSLRLVRRSRNYHLILGRDIEENGRVVMQFLRGMASGKLRPPER